MANLANLKKRWDERGPQAGRFPSKKPTPTKPRPQGQALAGNIVPSVVV